MIRISSKMDKPLCQRPRRLADGLNPDGARKVHSLVDKVYQPKNRRGAWEKVKANRGSGGIDGQSLEAFEQALDAHLERLHEELRADRYQPLPVRRVEIPKAGQPGERRPLGIPAVYDRVCQPAVLNRLEPSFEPVFDDSSFGYRPGRSAKEAWRNVWRESDAGAEGIVDADLKDYVGTIDHEKLLTVVARRVADGRVLTLIERLLTAGYMQPGRLFPTSQGTPQGGVRSPLLSNILLTPFDREMRQRGYQLTRYADDWVITCRSRREAEAALRCVERILARLGVRVNPQKTRIVHVRQGFAFLGYKIKCGSRGLSLPAAKINTGVRSGALYAYPTQKSVDRFKAAIRRKTQRRIPLQTAELIRELNPVIRGWGEYYKRAHVRRLFNQLDRWVVRRLWSHHHKRWRCAGWRTFPTWRLRGQLGLVSLSSLIPSLPPRPPAVPSCKLHAGEPHVQFERRTEASAFPGAPPPTRQARRRRSS
jgi:RNA-directed DNA polymerase